MSNVSKQDAISQEVFLSICLDNLAYIYMNTVPQRQRADVKNVLMLSF